MENDSAYLHFTSNTLKIHIASMLLRSLKRKLSIFFFVISLVLAGKFHRFNVTESVINRQSNTVSSSFSCSSADNNLN